METPLLLLRTLISFGLFSVVVSQVCCEGGYVVINEPRRSTQAVYNDGVDVPLCDAWIDEETWFRFQSYAGDAVVEREANNAVPMNHCGTQAPIYIRGLGSHPVNDYTSTTATVCANYGGSNTCGWMDTIQIYRCPVQGNPNYFYLYKLQAPPGCSLAYCAGEKPVCNQGDYWNGFECANNAPAMKGFPIFSGPHISGSGLNAEMFFTCQVQYDRQPNDTNARFRVTFLFDGQPLEYIGVNASSPPERLEPIILTPDGGLIVVLAEYHLRGRLGREISCQAESYWDGVGDSTLSMTSVSKYYAAFESTAKSYDINLSSGSTHNVPFKSTVPFTCSHCSNSECCRYVFRTASTNVSSPQCYLLWTDGDAAEMTVYFLPQATQDGNSYTLAFDPYTDDEISAGGRSLWRDYVIPMVKVTILPQSQPYKQCNSFTDPHLTTFDGANFDSYIVGDFYLAKAMNANQLMEIQVRQEVCNGGASSCTCGVIVREGNSALKISICEAGPWNPAVQRNPTVVRLLTQDPEDSSAVYVDATGLLFSIRMSSGLRVEVDARAPWFNVYVYLPSEYYGKTDSVSICGNSNGNPTDDSTNLEQFRIPADLSYFSHQPSCSSIVNVAATSCGCSDTYPVCSNTDPALEYLSPANDPYPVNWTSGVVCSQAPVSAVATSYDNSDNDFILGRDILFSPYTYDRNFGRDVSLVWPTPKGKTEKEVEQYCSNLLQLSPAYADCSAKVDRVALIAMCASDMQMADDWISARAYTFFFEQSCLNNIAASIRSSSDHSRDVLTSVSRKLCPNQCSGHGTCSGGTCACTTGYLGADCSIDQTLPPSLTGIIRGGACDVRARPCDVISVFGSGVALSSPLKCRFTDQNTGAHIETNGTFITAVEYVCPVPETTTHRRRRSAATRTSAIATRKVSITVDGVLYSNVLDFVLFDSVCMECNRSHTCGQKDNSCLISYECIADMALNSVDSSLQCISSVSRNSWTNVTDDAEQKTRGFGITL